MTEPTQPVSFVERVARNRDRFAYSFIAAGALLLALTVYWGVRGFGERAQPAQSTPEVVNQTDETPPPTSNRNDYIAASIWACTISILLLAAGIIVIARKPVAGTEAYETRLLLVGLGGGAGLLTALLGFVFAWRWQEDLVRWVNLGAIGGAKWVVAALAIFLGGLALMFFSVQLARTEERRNALLRRILYGSNAVLTGLLLLLLLAVVNIIVFLKLPDNMISTAAGFKGLGEPSKALLNRITDEVTVYLIMPESISIPIERGRRYNSLYADCRAMLNECQRQNSRVKVIPLSPVSDTEEIQRTMKRLKVPEEQFGNFGLLVGYGKSEEQSVFISVNELFERTEEGAIGFQGENRLMTELNFLSGGAVRPVVYFTQSNDEPSIGDDKQKKVSIRSMRALIGHLQDRKYEVRPLHFERGKVPDLSDATMVVVAAPRVPFEQYQLDILNEYMRPKGGGPGGKLVALLPAFPVENGQNVSPTGLESLLGEYGISVAEDNRLFSWPDSPLPPTMVLGTNTPEGRDRNNPMRDSMGPFLNRDEFRPFVNVRPVFADERAARRGWFVMSILATRPGRKTYREKTFNTNAIAFREQVEKELAESKNKSSPTAQEKFLTDKPLPFAAYAGELVEEGRQLRERPRVLVIGTDSYSSDDALKLTNMGSQFVEWMGKMLDFMREKPSDIEPKALNTYSFSKDPDALGLLYLPLGLVIIGIFGLGVGVWMTRRR